MIAWSPLSLPPLLVCGHLIRSGLRLRLAIVLGSLLGLGLLSKVGTLALGRSLHWP